MGFTVEQISNVVDVSHPYAVGVSHPMIGSYQNYSSGIVAISPGGLSSRYTDQLQTNNSTCETPTSGSAEHAQAADRFAHEILAILERDTTRSQRLMRHMFDAKLRHGVQ